MKKYITIAALLAAGTACVNAATSASDLNLNLRKWLTELEYNAGDSYTLSFSVNNVATGQLSFFQLATGWNLHLQDSQYVGVMVGSNGDPGDWSLNSGQATPWTDGVLTLGSSKSWLANGGSYNSLDGIVVTLSYTNEAGTLLNVTKGDKSGLITNAKIKDSKGDNVTDLLSNVSFLVAADSATLSVGNGSAHSITTAPVPEPSAFGLLAGIGALALVASRRRRK